MTEFFTNGIDLIHIWVISYMTKIKKEWKMNLKWKEKLLKEKKLKLMEIALIVLPYLKLWNYSKDKLCKLKIGINICFTENGINLTIPKKVQKCYICCYPSHKMHVLKIDLLPPFAGTQNLKIYLLLGMEVMIFLRKKKIRENWKIQMMSSKKMDIFMFFL